MKEVKGDIWDYHRKRYWIVITTNGVVKSDGEAVMGKGIALQAARKFPDLPARLGRYLTVRGNRLGVFPDYRIITLPVKNHWKDPADLALIRKGLRDLEVLWWLGSDKGEVYLVRPGCGVGGLDWKDVKPILEEYLDGRFTVVEKEV